MAGDRYAWGANGVDLVGSRPSGSGGAGGTTAKRLSPIKCQKKLQRQWLPRRSLRASDKSDSCQPRRQGSELFGTKRMKARQDNVGKHSRQNHNKRTRMKYK